MGDDMAWGMDYVTYTLIVDDIVHPDGSTAMACLGGGGPQTAFGIKLWASPNARVGLAAGVGADLPDPCRSWLESSGIDTGALISSPLPTLRAWQIFEEDGRRTQVWRVALVEGVWGMLRPSVTDLPPPYQKSRAYHAGVHPSAQDVPFIQGLRSTGAEIVSIEPYTRAEEIVPRTDLEALLSSAHIFSPNEEEAWSLVGPGPPTDVIGRLVELGGQVVCLRRGQEGAVVHRADTDETWEVPAFYTVFGQSPARRTPPRSNQSPSSGGGGKASSVDSPTFVSSDTDEDFSTRVAIAGEVSGIKGEGDDRMVGRWKEEDTNGKPVLRGVKDQTGCGNSFCGGFLAGWVTSQDLLTAALWGSVAASFMIEYEGVPPPSSNRQHERDARLNMLRPLARRLK